MIEKINLDDNLLIKGNNLLALYSLLPIYKGKVKLIYIDPPYNTGNDGFKYNDAFNHSTWLTFMKNRLEVARQLLADDGVIFVQLDYNEVHYCKVLMDEIFGRENLVNQIIWVYNSFTGQMQSGFARKHDTLLFYSKTKDYLFYQQREEKNITEMSDYKNWSKYIVDENKIKGGYMPTDVRFKRNIDKFIRTHARPPSNDDVVYTFQSQPLKDVWYIDYLDPKNKTEKTTFVGGQKPEALLERIISASTKEGDLVLDFFAGSGTTAAVAHKMGRRWIAIEQMDYVETITRVRLEKVLAGEQGGVSKNHNWKGGGGFKYIELI